MKYAKFIPLLALIFILSSCYHAKISTGEEPSARVIDKSFASSWIYGLVPPSEVRAAEECPNGVARVETKLSFVNMLVGQLTFGLYTPMNIQVTCAAGTSALNPDDAQNLHIAASAGEDELIEAVAEASEKAVSSNEPVYLTFN